MKTSITESGRFKIENLYSMCLVIEKENLEKALTAMENVDFFTRDHLVSMKQYAQSFLGPDIEIN